MFTRSLNHTSSRQFLAIVRQGFTAQRTFLGKNPMTLNPGYHFYIPLLHHIQKVDMRECSINIMDLHAYTKDNVPVNITGTLFYQISDSYKACFHAQNVVRQIGEIGTSASRSIIGTMDYDEIISDRNSINMHLTQKIGKSCNHWGVDCTKFEIQEFKPQNRDVELQLERQMKEERERRAQILNTEANVNIAEGQKRATILASEADLVASMNKAEALYVIEQRKADAVRYSKEQESLGMATQLYNVSDAVSNMRENEKTIEFLIEQLKLHNLSSIASGPNNSVYVLPNIGSLLK